MGQRHQIFVAVDNQFDPESNCKELKEFRNREALIFPYHHQWLYGFTALVNCMNLLETSAKIGWATIYDNPYSYLERLPLLFNSIMALTPREGEIICESVLYLGDEEPRMRDFYMGGDNNDGITIVHPQKKKYCFMFIHYDEYDGRVSNIPLTAEQYLETYYADYKEESKFQETLNKFNDYELLTNEEISELFPLVNKKNVVVP